MDTSNIDRYVKKGWHDRFWYEKQQRVFIQLFGAEYLPVVAKIFAATSINSSLPSNITLFRRAFNDYKKGLPSPTGKYLPNIRQQLQKVFDGRELSGRKISAFAAAMMGDNFAVVVDIWLLRAFGEDRKYIRADRGQLRSGGATNKQFSMIESWVRDNANSYNITPRQLSAAIWSGVRISMSGNRNTNYIPLLVHKTFNMYETTNK